MRQNMAVWHRVLYGVGGVAAIALGWWNDSGRMALMGLGAIGLIEALTGV